MCETETSIDQTATIDQNPDPSSPASPTSVCCATSVPNSDDKVVMKKNSPRRKSKSPGKKRGRVVRRKSDSSTESKEDGGKKSVTFFGRIRFKHVKHIDDYSDKEYFAAWYVEEDLADIFQHCVETVRRMVSGNVLDEEDGFCSRGLEYKTPTGAKTRKANKSKGLRAVLDEQERQRALGINDPERISKLYHKCGADSRTAYRLLAMKDQEEARPILQSKCSIAVTKDKQRSETPPKRKSNSATGVIDEMYQTLRRCKEGEDECADADIHVSFVEDTHW
ncbi:MAG: hypothetical protein SGILL_003172 [Bacillariaceae sp.]